jgi:4-hydroxybenzoate polyprenyltransferase
LGAVQANPASTPMWASRWWTYQRERFPLVSHGLLIAAFSSSTVGFSAVLRSRGAPRWPSAQGYLVAFATSFLFFLQLRIADEFKDREEDALYRPYRPVPRGLVSLSELGCLGIAAAIAQAALALWLSPALLPLLALVWLYLALMSCEFFARDWLKARPVTYMWTHMLIMPLIDLYCSACDWRVAGLAPPRGLALLLLMSLCNGFVLEIGRKIRAPQDAERAVQTYSALWGHQRAARIWLIVLAVTACTAIAAGFQIGFPLPAAVVSAVFVLGAALLVRRFSRRPTTRAAAWVNTLSGLWALFIYLSLGTTALLSHL